MPNSKTEKPIKIDRDIPYPADTKKSAAGRPQLYPFAEMEVGDSIFVETEQRYFSSLSGLNASLTRARLKTGFNLQWRPAPGGFRIWRYPGEYHGPPRKPAQSSRRNPSSSRRGK